MRGEMMAHRKIRIGAKRKAQEKGEAKAKVELKLRPKPGPKVAQALIKTARETTPVAVARKLSSGQMMALVDYSTGIDTHQKDLKKDVDTAKLILREYAEANSVKEAVGRSGAAKIGSSTSTIVGTATELARILKKEKKMHLFDDLVTVKLTELKQYIGEETLREYGFIKKKTEDYARVTLKAL